MNVKMLFLMFEYYGFYLKNTHRAELNMKTSSNDHNSGEIENVDDDVLKVCIIC